MPFDKISYDNEYAKQNYDVIRALVPKGKGKAVKDFAKSKGMSTSQIIVEALEVTYDLDLSKKKE